MDAYEVSATALNAFRLQMDVISSNLANINTTRKADGTLQPYHRRNVVFSSILDKSMNGHADDIATRSFHNGHSMVSYQNGIPTLKASIENDVSYTGSGVQISEVVEDNKTPMREAYDPSNPDADKNGYVQMPNINPVTEMVDMISASRAYEANVTAMQTTKGFDKAALEI